MFRLPWTYMYLPVFGNGCTLQSLTRWVCVLSDKVWSFKYSAAWRILGLLSLEEVFGYSPPLSPLEECKCMLSGLTFQFDLNQLTLTASCQSVLILNQRYPCGPMNVFHVNWQWLAVSFLWEDMDSNRDSSNLGKKKLNIAEKATSNILSYYFGELKSIHFSDACIEITLKNT